MVLLLYLSFIPYHSQEINRVFVERRGIKIMQSNDVYGWKTNNGFEQKPYFDYLSPFNNDYSIVEKNGLYGVVNKDGDIILDSEWYSIVFSEEFDKDSLVFLRKGQESRIYNVSNKSTIYLGTSGDSFWGFQEGCCIIRHAKHGYYTIVDVYGNTCFEKEALWIDLKTNGVFRYETEDDTCFVNMHGTRICTDELIYCSEMTEERALVILKDTLGYGLIDPQGNITPIEPKNISRTLFFSEGLLPIESDSKWGFINTDGLVTIPFMWKTVTPFSEGLAVIEADNGKWGYINTNGAIIIQPLFDNAFMFSEGRARVLNNDVYYFIDCLGEKIGEEWDFADDYYNGRAIVVRGNESFLLDAYGDVVYSVYGNIYQSKAFTDLWISVTKTSTYYIDREGQLIDYCDEKVDNAFDEYGFEDT